MSVLDRVTTPADIRGLSRDELRHLAERQAAQFAGRVAEEAAGRRVGPQPGAVTGGAGDLGDQVVQLLPIGRADARRLVQCGEEPLVLEAHRPLLAGQRDPGVARPFQERPLVDRVALLSPVTMRAVTDATENPLPMVVVRGWERFPDLVPPDITILGLRKEVVALLARRLPAIYSDPSFVSAGGLASYGPDRVELFRRSAGYVDRILRGEKAGDLPFQQPTKYQFIVNLKAARALNLDLSPTLLALADEVIE